MSCFPAGLWCDSNRVPQLGCGIARGNQFLVRPTMIITEELPDRVSSNHREAYTNLVIQVTNIKNYVLISHKP